MITLVEALNYRCLRYVSRPLKPFHVLVGPNASGKTTFLDVVAFLQELVSEGLDAALESRTRNPEELLFRRKGDRFELAIEARIPKEIRERSLRHEFGTARYEVAVGFDETNRQFEFKAEKLLLKEIEEADSAVRRLFPEHLSPPTSLVTPKGKRGIKVVINKAPGGNDNFYSEAYGQAGKGWAPSFRLGMQRSALGNLPEVEKDFPVAMWFREFLHSGVQSLVLNSLRIRQPSPPTRVSGFRPDGSNLPWVIAQLREEFPEQFRDWIAHLRTSLQDLEDIVTIERPEDRHCYMVYKYAGNLQVPSWLVSDGTLRLTALTLPAYLPDLHGIFMIEEPENGIHPRAVATAFDSLSSMYEAQVLMATHSLMVLNAAELEDILCFAKDNFGATDIVYGSEHPMLQDWRGEVALGTLLASGVLG